ncbi:hypothetical protein [Tolypothrix sp. VBCCA 56010]|uniref:hypothetical protein n=1 Tax=Tolypothrix sp. VBCCA 56010 TaxID=3137731 RepID=UPI003D7DD9FD
MSNAGKIELQDAIAHCPLPIAHRPLRCYCNFTVTAELCKSFGDCSVDRFGVYCVAICNNICRYPFMFSLRT